jgi:hypothetical protein
MRAAHLQTHLRPLESHHDAMQADAVNEHEYHEQQGPYANRSPRLEFVGNFEQQRRKVGQGGVPLLLLHQGENVTLQSEDADGIRGPMLLRYC